MSDASLEKALGLIDEIEARRHMAPQQVEEAVHAVLTTAGYAVTTPSRNQTDRGLDMEFEGCIDGRSERVGVEVKAYKGKVSGQTIYAAIGVMSVLDLDRVLIIALGGYSSLAAERAAFDRLGKVDLLDLNDLRAWLRRHQLAGEPDIKTIQQILRRAMRDLALRLAVAPEEIYDVEWRDMERLLGEVFKRLGFDALVTPSAKDGGIDVKLVDEKGRTFIVEVKHWLSRVGTGPVRRLVEVTAREGAKAGLLLATGGFADAIFDGLIEVKSAVHLGDAGKITSLCKAFYRAETQLWQPEDSLEALLLAETTSLNEPPALVAP